MHVADTWLRLRCSILEEMDEVMCRGDEDAMMNAAIRARRIANLAGVKIHQEIQSIKDAFYDTHATVSGGTLKGDLLEICLV